MIFKFFPFLLLAYEPEKRAKIVVDEIEEFNKDYDEDTKKEKYTTMVSSAFSFYRGSNHLFWHDFSSSSSPFSGEITSAFYDVESTTTWLQGDLHANNFGTFCDAGGNIAYDMNDFDEAIVADFKFDLYRLATSVVLVSNQISVDNNPDEALDSFIDGYLGALEKINTGNTNYVLRDEKSSPLKEFFESVKRKNANEKFIKKKEDKFNDDNSNLSFKGLKKVRKQIEKEMKGYSAIIKQKTDLKDKFFTVLDVARRLHAGTGSLGTPRFYVLINGDKAFPNRILDLKLQDGKPTAYKYIQPSIQMKYDKFFPNRALSHEAGFRALTRNADALLGIMHFSDDDLDKNEIGYYSVRQRSIYKDTFEVQTMSDLIIMSSIWGQLLARNQARADEDDVAVTKGGEKLLAHKFSAEVWKLLDTEQKRSEFRQLVKRVAIDYAAQVEFDYRSFKDNQNGSTTKKKK